MCGFLIKYRDMSVQQLNIINQILKEKKKRKKDLAAFLEIEPSSLNRSLKNPNISIQKLKQIASFLEVEESDLLSDVAFSNDSSGSYPQLETEVNKKTNLSNWEILIDSVNTQARTLEILAEAENRNSKNLEALIQLFSKK